MMDIFRLVHSTAQRMQELTGYCIALEDTLYTLDLVWLVAIFILYECHFKTIQLQMIALLFLLLLLMVEKRVILLYL